MRCLFLSSLLLCALADRPNVLLITADDLGWDSLGSTGNPLPGLSPNIDRLAADGLLIEHAFIATPICGPSRQALYTGQYPQRSGNMGHGKQPPAWWKGTPSKQSITSLLRESGYLTGLVGKHGSSWCTFSVPPHGSNAETGMGRNPDKYYQFVRGFFARAKQEGKPFYLAANAHDPHRHWARHRDETPAWIKAQMGSAYTNGKPYPDPKTNFSPADCPTPAPYPEHPRLNDVLATYYNSVNRMDQVVGAVLHALDESGLADDTIVLFLSDHGMAWDLSKWSLYPSGTKTPLIIRWPGKISAGRVDKTSIVSVVDIAPTLAEICQLPPMSKIDGRSFRCLLNGNPTDWTRREAFSCFNYMNNDPAIDATITELPADFAKRFDQYRHSRALNTTRFSYVWNGWSDGETRLPRTMLGEFHWLLGQLDGDHQARLHHIAHRAPEELYDIVKDPGCRHNLADNPQYRGQLANFRARMATLLQQTKDHELVNFRRHTN